MLQGRDQCTSNEKSFSNILHICFFSILAFLTFFVFLVIILYHAMHMPLSFNYILYLLVHPHFYCLLLSNVHNIRTYIHLSLNMFYFLFVSFFSNTWSHSMLLLISTFFSHLVEGSLPKNIYTIFKLIPKQPI